MVVVGSNCAAVTPGGLYRELIEARANGVIRPKREKQPLAPLTRRNIRRTGL
jgi:hypothetical protein